MIRFISSLFEISIGMSAMILIVLMLLAITGKKLTAKSRYLIWSLVILRLAIPLSADLLPTVIELPSIAAADITLGVSSGKAPQTDRIPPQSEADPLPETGEISGSVIPDEKLPSSDTPQTGNNASINNSLPAPDISGGVVTGSSGGVGGVIIGSTVPSGNSSGAVNEPTQSTQTENGALSINITALICAVWAAGSIIFLTVNCVSYRIYVRKILRTAVTADEETTAVFTDLCREMKIRRMPRLLVSSSTDSPAAFGLLRRYIVLPEIPLAWNSLRLTLAHELTHIRRGDLFLKHFSLAARCLHWFNPLVHYAAYRCETECELSCDEAVLAGRDEDTRSEYGETMLDIIRFCRRGRGTLTTHFSPVKNAVKARLNNILVGSGHRKGVFLIALCLVLCITAGTVIGCSAGSGSAETTDTEHSESEKESETAAETTLPEETESTTDTTDTIEESTNDPEPAPEETESAVLTPVVSRSVTPSQSYLGTWGHYSTDTLRITSISEDGINFAYDIFRDISIYDTAVFKDGEWVFSYDDDVVGDYRTNNGKGKLEFADGCITLTIDEIVGSADNTYLQNHIGSRKFTEHYRSLDGCRTYYGKIYPCTSDADYAYTPILGESTITFSTWDSEYSIINWDIHRCSDACTTSENCIYKKYFHNGSETSDDAELPYGEYYKSDGWNYRTNLYLSKSKDGTAEEPGVISPSRSFRYAVKVSDGLTLTLNITPTMLTGYFLTEDPGGATAEELELVNSFVQDMTVFCTVNTKAIKSGSAPEITGKIKGGDDAYITNGRDIMREATVKFEKWNDGYSAILAEVVLCNGNCTCTEKDLFRTYSYLPNLVKCAEYGTDDGFPFPTVRYERVFKNTYSEEYLRQQKRNYYYVVNLAEGIHLAIYIAPKDIAADTPENEVQIVDDMVKNVSVSFNLSGESYTETGLVTKSIPKKIYTWVESPDPYKHTYYYENNGEATVLYKSNSAYTVDRCELVKVEGGFDPLELAHVVTQGYARSYSLKISAQHEDSADWEHAKSVTVMNSYLAQPFIDGLEKNGDYDAIDRGSRHYVYIIEYSGIDEYLVMRVSPKDPASTPKENEQEAVDLMVRYARITYGGTDTSEDVEG